MVVRLLTRYLRATPFAIVRPNYRSIFELTHFYLILPHFKTSLLTHDYVHGLSIYTYYYYPNKRY